MENWDTGLENGADPSSPVPGGISWDQAWENLKGSITDPIVRLVSSIFSVIYTAVDALQLLVTSIGLGGGVIEEWLTEFRARLDGERAGFEDEIGEAISPGVKYAFVQAMAAAGLKLDEDEPLSAESITGAINSLLGEYGLFQNVFDKNQTELDLTTVAEKIIEDRTGVPVDLTSPEGIGNFAAAIIVGVVEGELEFFASDRLCPAVNTVANFLCKTTRCHWCMNDYDDCLDRRERDKRNRKKYAKNCTRIRRVDDE